MWPFTNAQFQKNNSQDQWISICVAKLEQCFSNKSILALALNTRESIAVMQNGERRTNAITAENIDAALSAIDTNQQEMYSIADLSRHANILSNRLGEDLLHKLKLKPSEILMLEAAFFYSCSDDLYVVNLSERHAPKKFELFLEKSLIDESSLHYSISDAYQTYSGHIDQELLSSLNLKTDDELSLASNLPKILRIIADINPTHVDYFVANGFMQHYQALIQTYSYNSEKQEEILTEKKSFAEKIDEVITQHIVLKLYEKYKAILTEIFDSTVYESLVFKARPHLMERSFSSLDELKSELEQLFDLIDEVNQAALELVEDYKKEKSLLELKMQEGLPPLLNEYVAINLKAIDEVFSSSLNNFSSVAAGLIPALREINLKIQEDIENTKFELDNLLNSLKQLGKKPSIHDDSKIRLEAHLKIEDEPFSLASAKTKIECMQQCYFEVELLQKQHKTRYLNALEALNRLLNQQTILDVWSNRRAIMLQKLAYSEQQLEEIAWSKIEEGIHEMESIINSLQENTPNSLGDFSAAIQGFLRNSSSETPSNTSLFNWNLGRG